MESWIASRLLTGAIEGGAVIAGVWLVCRLAPRIPAPVQAGLWWLASLKLLLALAPLPAIDLPILPAIETAPVNIVVRAPATTGAATPPINWLAILVALWILGVVVHAGRLLLDVRRLRGFIRRSEPLNDGSGDELALAMGLRRRPEVRVSTEIAAPLATGIRRPVVLLPAALAHEDRAMALCHEFLHVLRRDLALGWVPAIAERLFFFHPLARLAAREYVTAREAACDAGVIRALGVSRDDYGRLLVRLGTAHGRPALAAGGAASTTSSLRRRLVMLNHAAPGGRMRSLAWLLAAALLLTLAPIDVSARAGLPQAPQEPARVVPSPALPLELEAVLNQMRALEARMRADQADRGKTDPATVAMFNMLAEQANRIESAQERARRAQDLARDGGITWGMTVQRSLTERLELIRVQQEVLRVQLQRLAEENDRLLRETERLREALQEK